MEKSLPAPFSKSLYLSRFSHFCYAKCYAIYGIDDGIGVGIGVGIADVIKTSALFPSSEDIWKKSQYQKNDIKKRNNCVDLIIQTSVI